jgi:hypothetical protein
MTALPQPPDSLAPAPRQFYEELRRMLDAIRPRDLGGAAVSFHKGGVDLELRHATESEWTISAMVDSDGAMVGVGPIAHEHIETDEDGRPWPLIAVDFVAEILRGEIEFETEYRGRAVLTARHSLIESDGSRRDLCTTGLIRPALLMFWKPKRTEVARISFGAEG